MGGTVKIAVLLILAFVAMIMLDCWATGFCANEHLLGLKASPVEACAEIGMEFVEGKNNYCIDEDGGFHEILVKNNRIFINTGD